MNPREDLRVGACYQTPEYSNGSVMLCHPADAISSCPLFLLNKQSGPTHSSGEAFLLLVFCLFVLTCIIFASSKQANFPEQIGIY